MRAWTWVAIGLWAVGILHLGALAVAVYSRVMFGVEFPPVESFDGFVAVCLMVGFGSLCLAFVIYGELAR